MLRTIQATWAKEIWEKSARASVDDRAIWYAVPTDPAQEWLSGLDANSKGDVKRVMTAYRELCDRLTVDAEARADIAAYDDANERDEELFPVEVADRLIAGEHPIKVFRRYRAVTQGRLAELAGTADDLLENDLQD